jgi:hypothetical protein
MTRKNRALEKTSDGSRGALALNRQIVRNWASLPMVALPDSLTPEQHDWLVEDERRWQRAHRIANRHRR